MKRYISGEPQMQVETKSRPRGTPLSPQSSGDPGHPPLSPGKKDVALVKPTLPRPPLSEVGRPSGGGSVPWGSCLDWEPPFRAPPHPTRSPRSRPLPHPTRSPRSGPLPHPATLVHTGPVDRGPGYPTVRLSVVVLYWHFQFRKINKVLSCSVHLNL